MISFEDVMSLKELATSEGNVTGSAVMVWELVVSDVLAEEDVELVSDDNDKEAVLVIWKSVVTA